MIVDNKEDVVLSLHDKGLTLYRATLKTQFPYTSKIKIRPSLTWQGLGIYFLDQHAKITLYFGQYAYSTLIFESLSLNMLVFAK